MSLRITTVTAALLLVLAGCGSDEPSAADPARSTRESSPEPSAEPASPPSAAPSARRPSARGRVVVTAGSDFGTMLFDRTGQAIYLFDKETTRDPQCYGDCADAWPPVLTEDPPRARGEVSQRLLGTTERRDGSLQVTYAGHPLYTYAHEGKNEVTCHDVAEFGGTWLVVTPAGEPAA